MIDPGRFRRILGIATLGVLAIVVVLVLVSGGSDRSQVPAISGDFAPAVEVQPRPNARDLFSGLKQSSATLQAAPQWQALARALAQLMTLDGAGVDRQTGQLLLAGEVDDAAGPGPFLLEDVAVALHAAFYEPEVVGMTIDEDPDNKRGPEMFVKFFGGTRDTHLGWVMFECDRLMKSLGLGKDNLTHTELVSTLPGFVSRAHLVHKYEPNTRAPQWNRFWINHSTGRTPAESLDGKTLVEISDDRAFLWFYQHRMYVDTEQMVDTGKGNRLAGTGRQGGSAKAYADLFTAHYDALTQEFPVFGQLKQLSKLVVLAEWIRKHEINFDPELLHGSFSSSTTTPERTPTLATSTPVSGGTVQMFGGVTLEATPKYVEARDKKANALAVAAGQHQAELRAGNPVRWTGADGVLRQIVALGPPIRGPTGSRLSSTTSQLRRRRSPATGRPEATSQSPEVMAAETFGDFEIPATASVPHVFSLQDGRQSSVWTFTRSDGQTTKVNAPIHVRIISPDRSTSIQFADKPNLDAATQEPYLLAESNDGIRYYFETRTLRLEDGTTYRFNEIGDLEGIIPARGPNFQLHYNRPGNGFGFQAARETRRPRGPPVEEASGTLQATSRADAPADPVSIMTIQNLSNGRRAEFFDEEGQEFVVLNNAR
jgi:hypothetical protein